MTDSAPPSDRPRRRSLRRLFGLRRDQDGSTAVEFAIIAPIFFFLLFVIAETALIFVAEQVMSNAVFEAARLIRTGQAQGASMTDTQFKANVCGRMSIFVNCNSSNFYMDVRTYANFAAMSTAKPLDSSENFLTPPGYQFGTPNSIVVVRAYYQWPTNRIFGSLSLKNLANGKRLIGAWSAFCNEPYQSTSGQCGG